MFTMHLFIYHVKDKSYLNKISRLDIFTSTHRYFFDLHPYNVRDHGIDRSNGRKEEKCIFDIDARV